MPDERPSSVEECWTDAYGQPQRVSPLTLRRLYSELGEPGTAGSEGLPGMRIVRPDEGLDLRGGWRLHLEDGAEVRGRGRLPRGLPLGYHSLVQDGEDAATSLVVTPGRCHLPGGLRIWGWMVQLYALRSARSWGIGDLGDLAQLAGWSARKGAGMVMVNPLHAPLPGGERPSSPYSPSSRIWRDPIYISVEGASKAVGGSSQITGLATQARSFSQVRLLDRDAVWALKSRALEAVYASRDSSKDEAFDSWRASRGEALEDFAVFETLSEIHGRPWRSWPSELRHPRSQAVRRAASELSGRVRYHAWLQWLLDTQLDEASRPLSVVQDLAVGVDPEGADHWAWQDCYSSSVHIGAPPDMFNAAGQEWGLVPLNPLELRRAGFAPWIQALRAGLRPGGGLRIDHVMGLFRLWWVPAGEDPTMGAYVRYPAAEMLDLLCLESARAGALVIGEDLGTVAEGVRDELLERRILGSKVAWFEADEPSSWPALAIASVSTHDLPTLAGMMGGQDDAALLNLGVEFDRAATEEIRAKVREWVGAALSPDELASALYSLLGSSPCSIAVSSMEDALGVWERPNMPGTPQWPNWCLGLPLLLEDALADPRLLEVVGALSRGRSTGHQDPPPGGHWA